MKKESRKARAQRLGLVRLNIDFDMNSVLTSKLPEALRGLARISFRDAHVHPRDAKRVWDAYQKAVDNAPTEAE